ncbi:MAG TPA: glycosyltransferase [Acetobacteraceae bacterium]|jgi:glucosyl-dolichyl phosphate glucuronosyltransferase|nr:glycosyltransferase [Acetobacteraceae bacterium]
MELTVCICTHNRPHYVGDCLAGLARQTASPDQFAILIADSGSTGETPAELARLAAAANAALLRLDLPGVSRARNAGARSCRTPYIAYIDDDAIPASDWIERILAALAETTPPPAILGGRALPIWEAPLPAWWPPSLRGILSIIEHEGQGPYGDPALPASLAPYTVNMVVNVASLRAAGGFADSVGRFGSTLLSDEDVQLAWRLRDAGLPVRYDSRIVVHHQIQAARLTPDWLLSRLYWQGASTVVTRRLLNRRAEVWHELPRRLAVALLCGPFALLPRTSPCLISPRWRFAYALGFIRAAFGWHAAATARQASLPPAADPPAPISAPGNGNFIARNRSSPDSAPANTVSAGETCQGETCQPGTTATSPT